RCKWSTQERRAIAWQGSGNRMQLIFSKLLFRVKCTVRPFEQLFGCFALAIFRPPRRESEGNLFILNFNFEWGQTAQDPLYLSEIARREQHHKLITAHTRGQIGATNCAAQPFGKYRHCRVSHRMPVTVVELFEII